jgi:Uma2 family endonuclease
MTPGAPAESRYTAERYFALVDEGVLQPDDRVELLEGVIVAMSPQNPPHASAVHRVYDALHGLLGMRATVRMQVPLIVGAMSVPEPDVAVVPGRPVDYEAAHPTQASLVVEVADSSLPVDRLTKAAIYASAGIPDYWIVNLRDDVLDVLRDPDPSTRRYRAIERAGCGGRIALASFTDASVAVDDILPGH